MQLDPDFHFYLGSQTTPPCTEYVNHIIIDKPIQIPICQFKLLRENSLITNKPKEIHARITQTLNNSLPRFKQSSSKNNVPPKYLKAEDIITDATDTTPVYRFNKKYVIELPSVTGIVPMSYNKYLITHGIGQRTLKRWAYLAKKYGPKSKWAKKLMRLKLVGSPRPRRGGKLGPGGKPLIINGKVVPYKQGLNNIIKGKIDIPGKRRTLGGEDDIDCTLENENNLP